MVVRGFWIRRLRQVWERVPIAWLAGVRRVGKTTLVRSLPEEQCLYVNCDSPRAAQSVADPEFFFEQVRQPIVIFDEIHQLPDPTRLLKIGAELPLPVGTLWPESEEISGFTSSVTTPSGFIWGVTFKMMPMSVYSTEVMVCPVSVTRELLGMGTVCPTMMLASWLSLARM